MGQRLIDANALTSDNAEGMQARYVHQLIDEMARALVDAKRSGKEQTDADN